jgi:Bacterial PH domain
VPSARPLLFTASFDTTTKVISAAICIFLAAIAIVTHNAIIAGVGAALIFLAYAYSPQAYAIEDRAILVKRLIGSASIPLEGIRAARAATADDLSGCIRLWGNGGLFGYYGLFRTSKLGNCWWYVANRRNTVVVVTEKKTALFSPDDVEGLLAAVRAVAPVPEVSSTVPFLDSMQSQTTGAGRIGVLFGIAVLVVVLSLVGFAIFYSPGPPRFTLTPESLTIHDRFYPVTVSAAAVDVPHIRVVDIGQDPDWRPQVRTNGFANSHYRSGWFRVASGQKARLYWAAGRRLVLLPPRGEGNAILLEVAQPEQFVRDVQHDWTDGPY